jgi:hypothetical protein
MVKGRTTITPPRCKEKGRSKRNDADAGVSSSLYFSNPNLRNHVSIVLDCGRGEDDEPTSNFAISLFSFLAKLLAVWIAISKSS